MKDAHFRTFLERLRANAQNVCKFTRFSLVAAHMTTTDKTFLFTMCSKNCNVPQLREHRAQHFAWCFYEQKKNIMWDSFVNHPAFFAWIV